MKKFKKLIKFHFLAGTTVLEGVASTAAVFFAHMAFTVKVLRTTGPLVSGTDHTGVAAAEVALGAGESSKCCKN